MSARSARSRSRIERCCIATIALVALLAAQPARGAHRHYVPRDGSVARVLRDLRPLVLRQRRRRHRRPATGSRRSSTTSTTATRDRARPRRTLHLAHAGRRSRRAITATTSTTTTASIRDYGTNADFKRTGRPRRTAAASACWWTWCSTMRRASTRTSRRRCATRRRRTGLVSLFATPQPAQKGPVGRSRSWHKSPVRDEYYYGSSGTACRTSTTTRPAVREEAKSVATFWLHGDGRGRIPARRHPVSGRGGRAALGHAAGTHAFLREYAAHVRSRRARRVHRRRSLGQHRQRCCRTIPTSSTSYFAFELSDALLDGGAHRLGAGLLAGVPAVAARSARRPLVPVPAQPRPDAHADRARRRPRRARELAADALLTLPGASVRLLRRGDRDDGRQAGPAASHADALDARAAPPASRRGTPWEPLQPDSLTTNVAGAGRRPRLAAAISTAG